MKKGVVKRHVISYNGNAERNKANGSPFQRQITLIEIKDMITQTKVEARMIEFAGLINFNADAPEWGKEKHYAMVGLVLMRLAEGLTAEQVEAIIATLQLLPKNESAGRQKLVSLLKAPNEGRELGATLLSSLLGNTSHDDA